ncbi:MAG TPA: TetR/AcrR family transcriptional regulator [Ktedonobacteraceae bacterium]|nr:TetR/AcrR family transcriptional regulator [Ktedonobacteraceae bacterium]
MQTVHTHTTSLREKQRQEREALIIQAAEEIFQEKGYYEASMDEIAARVGIAKGTIYTHFPGKEELVLAIFRRNLEAFIQRIDAVIDTETTPRARLEALIQFVYTGLYSKHAQLLSSMYNGVDMKRMIMEKGGCMSDLWESVVSRVTRLLEEGKAAGELNPAIPTKVMLFSFFSLFSPKSYDRLLLGDELSREDLIQQLRDVYFNGIAN